MSRSKVAFAVAKDFPLLDDDRQVVDELHSLNIKVDAVIWDDHTVNWEDYAIVIIRSPWDYFQKIETYYNWVKQFINTKTQLLNPPQVVLNNIDKHYLLEFEQLGIPIIPTFLVEKDVVINLYDLLLSKNWDQIVIKPTVSAGAWETWRSDLSSAADDQDKFQSQVQKHAVLIQPFVPEIQSEGEWSVIYIDGKYSHSVLKSAKAGDYRIQEEHGGTTKAVEPGKDILRQTQTVIDTQPEELLYARVDGIIRDGQFLLMELEINEPSLFFEFSESSAKDFANAIVRRMSY